MQIISILKNMYIQLILAIEREQRKRCFPRIFRRNLRDTTDPLMCISDIHFKELYRFPKHLYLDLLREINLHLNQRIKSNGIPSHIKLLAALRFFATGSFQRAVGQDNYSALSQTSISRCVTQITHALNKVAHLHVTFPSTNEFADIKNQFYIKHGFPGIIGLIDGTHIKVSAPKKEVEHVYYCRKGGHSKNVLVICDCNYLILSVNAGFGGTSHDAYVWRISMVCAKLKEVYLSGVRNFWLLGDSGYPLQPWLMTPFGNTTSSAEEKYNIAHKHTRAIVERCIGVLKSRFRCLSKERVIFYEPRKAGLIINACAVLHNILVRAGVEINDINVLDLDESEISEVPTNNDFLNIGKRVRDNIVRSVF